MQIIEVKNNLVKVNYDANQENLVLSGFLVIKDEVQSFIAQVMHLEASHKGNFAIAKLLFNFDENGIVSNYNGSIPDIKKSILSTVSIEEVLEIIPVQNPVLIGEVAQQNSLLKLDETLFQEKLLICSEKAENNKILTENIVAQLANNDKKVLIIDVSGDITISENRIIAGKDFKLPLNYETINFIYEKGLDGANAQTKALIQEVFLEVQNYVKTLPEKYIPFNLFKTVVDEQYQELNLVELVLLKNKLLKYYEAGIFAQSKDDFNNLSDSLKRNQVTILDLSNIEPTIQREMISYAYSLAELLSNMHVIVNVNNSNSDKKLLKYIFTAKTTYPLTICSYSYKYLTELKQLAKNLILFAPIQQQDDFASYNAFLNKLNPDEFVIYGKATRYLPLIVKLDDSPQKVWETRPTEQLREVEPTVETPVYEEAQEDVSLDEQINRDVDIFYTAPKSEKTVQQSFQEQIFEEPIEMQQEFAQESLINEDLTEDDLDFIDTLNSNQSQDFIIEDVPGQENDEILFEEIQKEQELKDEPIITEPNEEPKTTGEFQFAQEAPQGFYIAEESAEEMGIAEEPIIVEEIPNVLEEEHVPKEAPVLDILPASTSSTPIVPIYSAEIEPREGYESETLAQGDTVVHPKYGKGVVEKMISYGTKTLCSIHFDNVGRRLLDPSLAEIKKV